MLSLALFLLGVAVSVVSIRYGIVAAHRLGVVDTPGGHKAHDTVTPFVGGVGVLAATLTAICVVSQFYPLFGGQLHAFLFGVIVMFVTGFADDILQMGYKIRFFVQAAVGVAMVFWGDVMLFDLGNIGGHGIVHLGYVGVPLTLIATIGAINALNMIDGIDGLSGSLSVVSLLLIAASVFVAGDMPYFSLIIMIAGGVAGFLFFNLRCFGQRRARCFLGDNGSMQLGFIFAWLLSDLSQVTGSPRVFTPVTTLWLFAVPLIDTLSVMLRRLWMKRSPFRPDRHHLHHLFLRAGFRVQDTVLVLAFVQLMFGGFGLLGMYAGLSETHMLIAFVLTFALCFYVLLRPWRFVPLLRRIHRLLGLTSVHAVGVYVSGISVQWLGNFSEVLNSKIGPHFDFRFSVYRHPSATDTDTDACCYGVVELLCDEQDLPQARIRGLIVGLRREFHKLHGLHIRQFVARQDVHDRRVGRKPKNGERRQAERRSTGRSQLVYRVLSAAGESSVLLPNV